MSIHLSVCLENSRNTIAVYTFLLKLTEILSKARIFHSIYETFIWKDPSRRKRFPNISNFFTSYSSLTTRAAYPQEFIVFLNSGLKANAKFLIKESSPVSRVWKIRNSRSETPRGASWQRETREKLKVILCPRSLIIRILLPFAVVRAIRRLLQRDDRRACVDFTRFILSSPGRARLRSTRRVSPFSTLTFSFASDERHAHNARASYPSRKRTTRSVRSIWIYTEPRPIRATHVS